MARKLKTNVVKRKYKVLWRLKDDPDQSEIVTEVKAESKEAARLTAPEWCEVIDVKEA